MSRFVLDSNNLWLLAINDNTIRVLNGPYSPDLNTHDVPKDVNNWKQAARIGSNSHCTHREMEVFGVVFNAPKLKALHGSITGQRMTVNREGFMVSWFNVNGNRTPNARSAHRRINDLFDWSKHGVQVSTPVGTEWDRYQYNTGKLMVAAAGGGSAQTKKEMEEKEKENQRLQAEKDKEIQELKKQAREKEEQQAAKDKEIEELKKQAKEKDEQQAANNKEMEELKKQAKEKDDQIAAKDKQISNLRSALGAFT